LTFKKSKNLSSIAKHTLEAKKFSNPYGLYPEMEKTYHLDLVKDDGIYVMSGNSKNFNVGKGEGSTVIYASGFNPKTNDDCWEDSRWAVGGDDFVEPIEMTESMLTKIAAGNGFSIDWNDDSYTTRV
jgi:hypothetical protein